jgi:DNA-binding transcriptional LysR family regulator
MFRNVKGVEVAGTLAESIITNDPAALREAACLGLGVSLTALVDVLPQLERGELIRLLPDWYADAGAISLYYTSRTLISAKTRVFVDFVVNAFRSQRLDVAFSANH